jgi:hypothetical protein
MKPRWLDDTTPRAFDASISAEAFRCAGMAGYALRNILFKLRPPPIDHDRIACKA